MILLLPFSVICSLTHGSFLGMFIAQLFSHIMVMTTPMMLLEHMHGEEQGKYIKNYQIMLGPTFQWYFLKSGK